MAPYSDFGALARELEKDGIKSELRNDSIPGIGPVLTITPQDHFGGAGVWLLRFTGRNSAPYFEDITGKFLTMQDLNLPLSLSRT